MYKLQTPAQYLKCIADLEHFITNIFTRTYLFVTPCKYGISMRLHHILFWKAVDRFYTKKKVLKITLSFIIAFVYVFINRSYKRLEYVILSIPFPRFTITIFIRTYIQVFSLPILCNDKLSSECSIPHNSDCLSLSLRQPRPTSHGFRISPRKTLVYNHILIILLFWFGMAFPAASDII